MSFVRPAAAYDDYMGRYSRRLAPLFADFAGVSSGMRALDVGAGPGALTAVLAERLGPQSVAAAEPSETFHAALASRVPDADVRLAPAEALPWEDGSFDAVLAQLVVNFMADAEAGVREMARVVRPGGVVAACTWDLDGGMTMLHTFWQAALALAPEAPAERSTYRFAGPDLDDFWREECGLEEVGLEPLDVTAEYVDFQDFWGPFSGGVGPAGSYFVSLSPGDQDALREECRRRLDVGEGAFTLSARAWAVRGVRPAG